MQVKDALKQTFGELEGMIKSNKKMQFDVNLPQISPSMLSQKGDRSPFQTSVSTMIPISKIAQQVFNDGNVIAAFKSLYKKYIDSNNAPFMINIASKNRERLMKSLDSEYYLQQGKKPSIFKLSINISLSLHSSDNGDRNSSYVEKSMIDVEFKKHSESIQWLLAELITQMDPAAHEISVLMNDSFVRWKLLNM